MVRLKNNLLNNILVIVLIATVTRAAFTLWHGPAPLVAEMNAYWEAAAGIAAGKGFYAGHGFRAFIPPGYAFFLTPFRMAGSSPLWVRLFQAALAGLTTYTLYKFCLRITTPRGASAAAWVFALWPPSFVFNDFLLTETLFTVLLVTGLAVWANRQSWTGAVIAGITWGFAALTREIALFFFPVTALVYLINGEKRLFTKSLIATGVVVLCVSPWTVRNAIVTGGFIPVTSKSSVDFYIYNHNNFIQILNNESDQPTESKLFADAADEVELTKLARRRAIEWMVSHPTLFFFKGIRTEMNFLGLERDFFQHQMYGYFPELSVPGTVIAGAALILPSAILLPFTYVGIIRLRRSTAFAPALGIVIIYVTVTFIAYSFTRQRYPLTPIFIAAGASLLTDGKKAWLWFNRRPWVKLSTALFVSFLLLSWGLEIYLDLPDYLRAR